MSEEKKTEGGLTKRFDGDGSNPAKDYERWRRWCRAYLTVQRAKGVGPEAHGSLVFSLLDGTALRALDQVPMDRVEEIGGEEVIFQILDDRFPAEATHDRLGSVLDQVFDLKVEKGETTAVFTGKVRAAFSSAEAEGVVLPDVARGYLLLRFAKLSAERKAVVMAAARQSYAEKDVAAALRTTFPEGLYSAARQSSHAYQVEYDQGQADDDEETMEEEFDVYLTDAGYQPEEEIEEQDAIDALLTWKQTRSSIAQTKLSRGFGNQGQLKKLAARVKCFKCRQVGHFSRDCPKRGTGGSKGSTKDGNHPPAAGAKVNYVFMVWSQPDTPNIRTEYHWTVDENEEGELEQNYNPPIGPEMYGHEMQALVAGWSHVPGDFWYTRGSEVIREHVLPRTRLFTPAASNCPVPLHELCDSRSTHLFKEDGSQAVHFSHNWKARGEAHKDIGVEWTGRTVFYMKDLPFTPIDEEIDMLAQAYKDELDTAQDEALKESGSEDSMMEETDEEAEYLEGETVVALVHAAGHGVVDTGCGRGLVGERTLQRHEKVLNEHGYEIKEMLHQPHKFRYGNSAVDVSHRTVQIPVFLAGVQLWLRVHVVQGDVPLLISKRFMKCLGAIIDMRQGQVTFTRAHLAVPLLEQRDGSYQINLLDFQKPPKIKDAEVEVLATDLGEEDEEEGGINNGDDPMGTIPEEEMEEYVPTSPEPEGGDEFEEIETPEEYEVETPDDYEDGNPETQDQEEHEVTGDQDNLTASEPEEEFCEEETGDLGVFKAGERKKIQGNLTEILQAEPERPSVVEVFCPGRFAERAGDFGLKVIGSFDLSSGWDWKKASDRKKVWDLIEEEEPDLMILSPPCGPLSRLQNSTPPWKRADPEQHERDVIEARAMVAWCTRIARDRMRKGKYFIFESSATCAAWRLPAMGHLMDFDECQRVTVPACSVGLRDRESKLPFKKSWSFLTNAEAIAAMLDKLECSQDHDHQVVEGRSGGQLRSVQTQVYPRRLINIILGGFACQQQYEAVCYPVSQADVQLESGKEMTSVGRDRVLNAVRKMHINLGHASTDDMVRILKHHGARPEVLELVRSYQCDLCESRRPPKAVRESAVPRDLAPLRYIGFDVKWLPTWKRDMSIKAVNIVCRATGFQQMYPFRETENSDLLVRLYRHWTRSFGRPRYIKFDASRCNLGQTFLDALERDGTTPLDVPGEAHEQMGDVEVQGRHFATMLTKVIDQMMPEDYPSWLECVDVTIEAKNALMRRGGYSPNQLVFGRDPEVPGDDLLTEDPNPIANGAIVEDAIAAFSFRARQKAREAVLQSLDHRAARIALNTRPRPKREFRPGDEVAVWRRGRGIKKNMARWRGPGIVAGEAGGNYWVSMPGSFIKCSPEQLRLRTATEREADRFLVRDIRAAAAQLFPEAGPSNKTQKNFIDITKEDFPPGDLFPETPAEAPELGQPQPEGSQPDPEAPDHRSGSQPMTINSSLSDQLESLSATEREAWKESSERADRLDGHCRPRGSEPEPKRSRSEQRVGGMSFPPSLPTPPGEHIPRTPESLPQRPTTPQSLPPVPVSSGSSIASSGTSALVTTQSSELVDSAAQNVALHEQGSSEDVNFVLRSEESSTGEVHVLLAGGRKEINPKEDYWRSPEGKELLVRGVRKEVQNCIEDKHALRPCSVDESRRIRQQHPERVIPSRLVLTPKTEDTGEQIVKARWTARGDKDPDLLNLVRSGKTQSPTISTNGRYTVLQVIASNQFTLQLGDVTGAFLETKELKRDQRLWMSGPKNFQLPDHDPEQLFEVIRPLYGLNDSPQKWFSTFDETVRKLGWQPSRLDPCLYMLWDHKHKSEGTALGGIMGVHVDDVVLGGRGDAFEKSIVQLKQQFPFRKWMTGKGTFCGSSLTQDETGAITVSQEQFAENMVKPKLRTKEDTTTVVNAEEATSLKSVLGAGLWLAKETRTMSPYRRSIRKRPKARHTSWIHRWSDN